MNDSTKLRIRVAELMGWKITVHPTEPFPNRILGEHENLPWAVQVPNYPNDLNVCHEFEQTLSPKEYDKYQSRVWNIAVMETPAGGDIQRAYLSATAEHRSRAFIAVMEKQDSGEPGAVSEPRSVQGQMK